MFIDTKSASAKNFSLLSQCCTVSLMHQELGAMFSNDELSIASKQPCGPYLDGEVDRTQAEALLHSRFSYLRTDCINDYPIRLERKQNEVTRRTMIQPLKYEVSGKYAITLCYQN